LKYQEQKGPTFIFRLREKEEEEKKVSLRETAQQSLTCITLGGRECGGASNNIVKYHFCH
jgi:hypothetical protein